MTQNTMGPKLQRYVILITSNTSLPRYSRGLLVEMSNGLGHPFWPMPRHGLDTIAR